MRSQAQQMLIYALAIIIVSLILLYGFNAIKNLIERSEQAELVLLKKDLTTKISSLSYGSVEITELRIPSKYTEACFADKNSLNNSELTNYPLIKDSIETGVNHNFFLEPKGEAFNIGTIEVQNGFFCAKAVRSKIKLRLEGKGDRVLVSPE